MSETAMHAHDGYEPHSHEIRADHLGVDRAGAALPAVLQVRLPHVPAQCPDCGTRGSEWPFGVFGGRVNLTCPHCHVPVAALVAVTDNHEH